MIPLLLLFLTLEPLLASHSRASSIALRMPKLWESTLTKTMSLPVRNYSNNFPMSPSSSWTFMTYQLNIPMTSSTPSSSAHHLCWCPTKPKPSRLPKVLFSLPQNTWLNKAKFTFCWPFMMKRLNGIDLWRLLSLISNIWPLLILAKWHISLNLKISLMPKDSSAHSKKDALAISSWNTLNFTCTRLKLLFDSFCWFWWLLNFKCFGTNSLWGS